MNTDGLTIAGSTSVWLSPREMCPPRHYSLGLLYMGGCRLKGVVLHLTFHTKKEGEKLNLVPGCGFCDTLFFNGNYY